MTERTENHAVVLGGGIAGLLAARVLADAYHEVTVVDRDGFARGSERGRARRRAGTSTRCSPAGSRCWRSCSPA